MKIPFSLPGSVLRRMPARLEAFAARFERRERAAGLVVEHGRVRFAEFSPDVLHPEHAGGRVLVREGAMRLPPGTIREGALARPEALVQALRELRKRGAPQALAAERVILSVPLVRAAGHTVSLPASIRSNEEAEAIRLAAERLLPFPIDEAYVDWQEFPSSLRESARERSEGEAVVPSRQFLLVAARKEDVDPYVRAVEASGLRVLAVEPLSVSVGRGLDARAGVTYAAEVFPDAMLAFARDANGSVRFLHHKALPPLPDSSLGVRDVQERAETVVNELTSFIRFLRAEIAEHAPEIVIDGVVDETLAKQLTAFGETFGMPVRLEHATHALSRAAARGAATRAMFPRGEDRDVSLTAMGTEEAYALWRAGFFLRSSLRALTAATALTALLFAGAFAMAFAMERSVKNQTERRVAAIGDRQTLQDAEAVNAAIFRATALLETAPIPGALLMDIRETVARFVRVDRITVTAGTGGARVELSVFAQTVEDIVAARNGIAARYAPGPIDIPADLFFQQPAGVPFVFVFSVRGDE